MPRDAREVAMPCLGHGIARLAVQQTGAQLRFAAETAKLR
jgi:hypothetical protein